MNIPTGNNNEELKQRKDIISQLYRQWTDSNPDKKVFNPSLKGDVNNRFVSITETMRHAAKTYRSTLALFYLDRILRNAVIVGKPKPPKKGVANQKPFKYLLETHCLLHGIGMAKMMVGVKRSGEMILYCITVMDQ
ncbi:MAG: hypothetical protein IKU00_10865 [Bacteroidales bacterium]|nr:hypothetical protein [Bacteroidales bacterium]